MSKWFDKREFALYKGDEFVTIGTIREIAKYENTQPQSIAYLKTEAYKRKIEKRKISETAKILISVDENEEDET